MQELITYTINSIIDLITSDYYYYTTATVMVIGVLGLIYKIFKK